MAKWTKFWIIIAACFLIGGAAAFVIGMSAINWDFMNLDTLEYTEVSVSAEDIGIASPDEIKELEYYGHDWNVSVSKGETFFIKYYITEDTKAHSVTFADGSVVFRYEEDWFTGLTMFKGLKKLKMKVEVTVPENIDLTFDSVNLNIKIDKMDTGRISVNGTNADLDLKDLTAGDIKVTGTNVDVGISGCKVGDITADATNCGVNIQNTAGSAISVTGTNVDFDLKGGSFTTVRSISTNNDVNISGCDVTDSFTFKGTNTDVELSVPYALGSFKSISFSGTNYSAKINGEKASPYSSETGTVTFSAEGTNVKVRIYTVS